MAVRESGCGCPSVWERPYQVRLLPFSLFFTGEWIYLPVLSLFIYLALIYLHMLIIAMSATLHKWYFKARSRFPLLWIIGFEIVYLHYPAHFLFTKVENELTLLLYYHKQLMNKLFMVNVYVSMAWYWLTGTWTLTNAVLNFQIYIYFFLYLCFV